MDYSLWGEMVTFWPHFGWDYTPAQALWLDAGYAPAGHINWFTYIRPSAGVTFGW